MNQYAHMPDAKTIHSAGQMEWYNTKVDEKSPVVTQRMPSITTLEGYVIPISLRNGLPYIKMRPPTDAELEGKDSLIRVPITSHHKWNPKVLDSQVPEEWYDQPKGPSQYTVSYTHLTLPTKA